MEIAPEKIKLLVDKISSIVNDGFSIGSSGNTVSNRTPQKCLPETKRKKIRTGPNLENFNVENTSFDLSSISIAHLIEPKWLQNELLSFICRVRLYRAHVNSTMKDKMEFVSVLKAFEESAFEALNYIETPSTNTVSTQAFLFSVLVTLTDQCELFF